MSAKADKHGSGTEFRIQEGGPWSNAWKVAAAVGALGLLGAGAGFASDSKRFAFSYLFGFVCFLTIALGSLFFVLIQHLTHAGWSVSVRRVAEFMMAGLPVFAVLVIPVIALSSTLYPWLGEGGHGGHGAEHPAEHGNTHGAGTHGKEGSLLPLFEKEAHADQAPVPPPSPHSSAAPMPMPMPMPGLDPHRLPRLEHGPLGALMGARNEAAVEAAEHKMHAGVLASKHGYLNKGFFLIRAFLYFAAWILLARRLFSLSVSQDKTGDVSLSAKAQAMSPIGVMLFGVSITFAGIDWIMSLDPMWYSTIWGVQIFAGSVVAMFAVLILVTLSLRKNKLIGDSVTVEHFHDLGKLQFGFLVFWAYITFSQFFLVWYSNIPEETTFYSRRWHDFGASWQGVSWALFALHFVLPFAVLLSRNVKRNLSALPVGAAIILVMHFVEIYWIIMPVQGPLAIHWMDIACFLGVGGIYFSVVFRQMSAHPLVPMRDPRLQRALHFEQA